MAVIDTAQSSRQAKNFLGSLFDFSFHSFITTRLIKLLYLFAMAGAALAALAAIATGFQMNTGLGVVSLLVSPILFLVVLVYARVGLELVMVFFQIEEHCADMARMSKCLRRDPRSIPAKWFEPGLGLSPTWLPTQAKLHSKEFRCVSQSNSM